MTERAQNADFRRKPQIFADSPLLLEIPAFSGRRKPQETADFRRKPKIFAENRRKPQIGLRHLRCVSFSSALACLPFVLFSLWLVDRTFGNTLVVAKLSAPNRAIWLRLRFVIRIANRKSLVIWDSVNLLRKAQCSDLLYRNSALRF